MRIEIKPADQLTPAERLQLETLSAEAFPPDGTDTQWSGGDWHVFVHVLNPDGTLAAQHDSPPLLGLYPFWQWAEGDRAEDVHPIDLAQLPQDRQYTIAVGLYDPSTGERLTPIQAASSSPEDRAVGIGQFAIGGSPDVCH